MKISVGDKLFIYREGGHVLHAANRQEVTVSDISLVLNKSFVFSEVEVSLRTATECTIKTSLPELKRWLEYACIFQHEREALYK